MKSKEIGENGIIEIFKRNFSTLPHIILGVNANSGVFNDAGIIELDDGNLIVVTTDMIGAKTHFPPHATGEQIGKKSIVVNISDLAAMGAKPLGLVISVGIPADMDINFLDSIARGMNLAAQQYSTCIFGGDVNKTDDLLIAGTAIGIAKKGKIFDRNHAKEGDIVCVTGSLGSSAAGYYAWKNDLKVPDWVRKEIEPKFLEPTAKLRESLALVDLDVVSSCGDISDGLGWELYKTGQASSVGFKIYENLIPVHDSVKYVADALKIDLLNLILYHGEDFELILTIKRDKYDKLMNKHNDLGFPLIKIGEVCNWKEKNSIVRKDGTQIKIKDIGYDQFKNKK